MKLIGLGIGLLFVAPLLGAAVQETNLSGIWRPTNSNADVSWIIDQTSSQVTRRIMRGEQETSSTTWTIGGPAVAQLSGGLTFNSTVEAAGGELIFKGMLTTVNGSPAPQEEHWMLRRTSEGAALLVVRKLIAVGASTLNNEQVFAKVR